MRDTIPDGLEHAGALTRHWRQLFAAALLLLTGLVFTAAGRFNRVDVPDLLWLALIIFAALAVAAQPAPLARTRTPAAEPVRESAGETSASQVIFAAASHELRTPLNAIVGFSELLRDAETSGTGGRQREEFAGAIVSNARQLQQRLNDVLDANRLSSKSLNLAEQACDLAEIIEVVCRDRYDAAAARGVTIVARIADGIACHGDANRLRQAIACVIDNAIAFSPGDGIINVNMLRGEGGGLVVTVTDAGPGISPEDSARAFEPFRQLDEGAARHHAGLGLGLYIARGILRLHGGDVTLESSPAAGTEVRLFIPAARVNWMTLPAAPLAQASHVA